MTEPFYLFISSESQFQLREDLQQRKSKINQLESRLADQRSEISDLNNQVQEKDTLLETAQGKYIPFPQIY